MYVLVIGIGLICVLVMVWFWSTGGKYKAVFADEHFLEVAGKLSGLKEAAFAKAHQPLDGPMEPNDRRTMVTSAGLTMIYIIVPTDAGYEHRLSVSLQNGLTAHAVGEMFALWGILLLGEEKEQCEFYFSQRTVHYAVWIHSVKEQAQKADSAGLAVTGELLAGFREKWAQGEMRREWKRFEAYVNVKAAGPAGEQGLSVPCPVSPVSGRGVEELKK
jgi:hypothetical protein